jgi:hypothetical protein
MSTALRILFDFILYRAIRTICRRSKGRPSLNIFVKPDENNFYLESTLIKVQRSAAGGKDSASARSPGGCRRASLLRQRRAGPHFDPRIRNHFMHLQGLASFGRMTRPDGRRNCSMGKGKRCQRQGGEEPRMPTSSRHGMMRPIGCLPGLGSPQSRLPRLRRSN